jgi:hypothetical protein
MGSLEKAARAVAFVTADHKHTSDEWWDSLIPDEQTCAFDMARAVLLAVREPDIDTGLAGAAQVNKNMRGPHKADYCAAKDAFTAMIDAILAGGNDGSD